MLLHQGIGVAFFSEKFVNCNKLAHFGKANGFLMLILVT